MSADWEKHDRPCPPCPDCGTELYEKFWGNGGWRQTEKATEKAHGSDDCVRVLKLRLAAEPVWEDRADEWTAAIEAAHPVRSGSHNTYATAMRMVGNRHSKGELVALVNWLLVKRKRGG